MLCKLCGKEIPSQFYRHLNGNHKITNSKYFNLFPEQKQEYERQKKPSWNKGLTAKDHPSIAKYAKCSKEYSNKQEVRDERSRRMKQRYAKGDILTLEQRMQVVKIGSDAWVKKITSVSDVERKELLKNFTTAGNVAQAEKRDLLTPEDYERLYPFAKGKARWYNCDQCGKKMIAWFGGKPRARKRFCNKDCWNSYQMLHPHYGFPHTRPYYSTKMGVEFHLHSSLEEWFAILCDKSNNVVSWSTVPFNIRYEFGDKRAKYYPDFFVNQHIVFELKSYYFFKMNESRVWANKCCGGILQK